MELDSHQVPHLSSISIPQQVLTSFFLSSLNPSPSGSHTPSENTLWRLCKQHWEALMSRDKQALLHHLPGLSCCLWLHPECCASDRIFFRAKFLFLFGLHFVHTMVYQGMLLLFWKATCLAGLLRCQVLIWRCLPQSFSWLTSHFGCRSSGLSPKVILFYLFYFLNFFN